MKHLHIFVVLLFLLTMVLPACDISPVPTPIPGDEENGDGSIDLFEDNKGPDPAMGSMDAASEADTTEEEGDTVEDPEEDTE